MSRYKSNRSYSKSNRLKKSYNKSKSKLNPNKSTYVYSLNQRGGKKIKCY